MTATELASMMDDTSKRIEPDIEWRADEDHSPSSEFRVDIASDAGYPIFIHGSYNPLIPALNFSLIHRSSGRVYGLCIGKDHHNPACDHVGVLHKHRWSDVVRDKEAFRPSDITAPAADPVRAWQEFCSEAKIRHEGRLMPPPPAQMELL